MRTKTKSYMKRTYLAVRNIGAAAALIAVVAALLAIIFWEARMEPGLERSTLRHASFERSTLRRASYWATLDKAITHMPWPLKAGPQSLADWILRDCLEREQAMLRRGYLQRRRFDGSTWTQQDVRGLQAAAKRQFSKDWWSMTFEANQQVIVITAKPEQMPKWERLIRTISAEE